MRLGSSTKKSSRSFEVAQRTIWRARFCTISSGSSPATTNGGSSTTLNPGPSFSFSRRTCCAYSAGVWPCTFSTLPVAAAVALTLQMLDGLDYVHNVALPDGRRGLVHRDLKPQNIVLAGSGSSRVAKVADFGLSKEFDAAGLSGLTRSADMLGTPRFMARQQVVNFKHSPPAVDVWAAAAVLYFLLSGESPRPFPPGMDRWVAILEMDPVPILDRVPTIPRRLATVIDRALTEDPPIPFPTAAEFKRALEAAL
jgi:serine/threonine protein kinase